MPKDANEAFVSGLYDPKDDAQNRPLPSIKTIANNAIKERRVRRFYGSPLTPQSVALTKRITGDKD